jgi:hypothetical protein
MQFLHWFKPSEPLLFGLLEGAPLHMPRRQVLDDVFAWSVYWQPVAYLVAYSVFRARGYAYRAALVFVSAASLATITYLGYLRNQRHKFDWKLKFCISGNRFAISSPPEGPPQRLILVTRPVCAFS